MLNEITITQLEAVLSYMYVGEVEVKYSDLPSFIKAAEWLRIKGLASFDEDPVPNEYSENQQKVNISESVNTTRVSSSHCPSFSKERQKKESRDNKDTDSNVDLSNLVPIQQSSSFSYQKSPAKNIDDPDTSPGDRVKAKVDIENEGGLSNLENWKVSCQNLGEIVPKDNGMDDSNEIEEDYPSFTEIDTAKKELNIGIDEDWMGFEGAGPSGLQKVCLHLGV